MRRRIAATFVVLAIGGCAHAHPSTDGTATVVRVVCAPSIVPRDMTSADPS
jgi:hypothetical protein